MGIRIKRAIGWGMEWNAFEEACLFGGEAQETSEWLWETFQPKNVPALIVPEDVYKEIFYGESRPRPPVIIERNLLARNFTEGGRVDAKLGTADDLYQSIDIGDGEQAHICFFPNLNYAKDWCRRDNILDYQFEAWRREDGQEHLDPTPDRHRDIGARNFVKYLPYGHYPFTNYLMLEDGTPQEWDHFTRLQKRPDILPAVPSEIRWYLKELKVMDDAGVNKLRPILAQWWS